MTYTCQRCGYAWTPRPKTLEQDREKPVRCPNQKCQSVDRDKQGS